METAIRLQRRMKRNVIWRMTWKLGLHRHHMGCSESYGPLLAIDSVTPANIQGCQI